MNFALLNIFERVHIEDLWIPFFCTSTDICRFEERVHTEGLLWRYIRASMSLVGFVPPMCDHDSLLVDGGYANNYPVVHAPKFGGGLIIKVIVAGNYDPLWTGFGETLSGWWELFRWLTSICWRRSHFPAPTIKDIQERLMFFSDCAKMEETNAYSHLTIQPPVSMYPLLGFGQYPEIIQKGYEHAKPVLRQFLMDHSGFSKLFRIEDRVRFFGELSQREEEFQIKKKLLS